MDEQKLPQPDSEPQAEDQDADFALDAAYSDDLLSQFAIPNTGLPDIDLETDAGLAPIDDTLDIDAILAAVGSMGDLSAQPDGFSFAALDDDGNGDDLAEANAVQPAAPSAPSTFTRPTLSTLGRGSIASLIPALLLIATGGYFTFALTLPEATLPLPQGIMPLLGGVIGGVALLAYWLHTGGWARGALFSGLLLIFGGGALYLPQMMALPNASAAWIVLIAAVGLAIALTGILGRPRSGQWVAVGFAVMIAAAVTQSITLQTLPDAVNTLLNSAWMVVLPIAAFLMLVSLILRRRTA